MPLPTTGSISLQGHSRPGEGVTTKPKLAMIVRMTEETLDALQNLSMEDRMEFEFGDRPGIHIQETFFPMRFNKEKENHELFIRTTTAVRPNAPLKLNANVVGKFNVERDLSEKLSKQIQEASAAAAKQKTERRVIMLDKPLTTTGKALSVKRKAPPKATATKVMTVKNVTAPSTNTSVQQPAASSSSLSQEQVLQLRQRLVHYLALGTATAPDILKNVGGIETDWDVRRKIIEILNEVAEEVRTGRKGTSSASQDTKWQLKQKFWLEVRPYAYPDYTDNVRTTVARTARTWLSSMKIPESDPAWNHVKFRTNGSSGPNGSTATGQARAMNGTSSAAAKEKAKSKSKAKGVDIKAKSEAVRPAIQAPPSLARTTGVGNSANVSTNGWSGKVPELDIEREEGEISQSNTPPRAVNSLPAAVSAPRRPPGSRQTLAPPSATPQLPARPTTPQPTPSPSHPSTNSLPPPKRTGPVDARGPRRSLPEPSERARAAPPIPPPAPVEKKPVVTVTKAIPAAASPSGTPASAVARERAAREREREALKKEKEKERESDRESLRARERERERERERDIVKRERDRESDLESARAVKHERERESDLDELRERRRELKREKIREARERDREVEREEALLEAQRKERVREKKEAAIRAEATERIERERADRKRSKDAATSAATSSKAGTKRKQPEYSDDSDSSDWGIEERKPKKSSMATTSSVKPKRPKDDVPVKAPSTVRVKRESTPPLKRVKRELSPPPPPPPKKATTIKSSVVSVVSSRETSQSLKTKVKGRDHDRDRERERIRDRDRDRERNGRARAREREQEHEQERDWSARVSNGSNGASRKRPPPDYTSSSEEEEDVKPLKKIASKISRKPLVDSPHASQTPPISAARPRPSHTRPAASPQPPPSPSDHDSLRTRYSSTYIAYIDVFQKLCAQKAKISAMLHRRSGSVSAESDADVDMLSPEELESLKSQHKRLHEELQSIARVYAQ